MGPRLLPREASCPSPLCAPSHPTTLPRLPPPPFPRPTLRLLPLHPFTRALPPACCPPPSPPPAGRLEEAKPLLESAAAALEASLGADDLRTANALNSLALLRAAQGDAAAAHRLLLRAARPRVKQLGMAHPDSAATLHSLAELLRAQGDEGRALAIQRDLLAALREAEAGAAQPPRGDEGRKDACAKPGDGPELPRAAE